MVEQAATAFPDMGFDYDERDVIFRLIWLYRSQGNVSEAHCDLLLKIAVRLVSCGGQSMDTDQPSSSFLGIE